MQTIEELYATYARTVFRYLLSMTHSEDIAEELTQETFYQAIRSLSHFDGSCKVSTWLCGIAKNTLLTYRRRHPLTEPLEAADTAIAAPASPAFSDGGQVELLRKLHALSGEMREVMYLRLLGDLSFREIGEIFEKTENWARVTYYRGKEKVKRELEKDE